MSVTQQAVAKRRRMRQDLRWNVRTGEGTYHAKRSRSLGGYTSVSQRYAAAKNRKRVQRGGVAGSIGHGYKG